MADQQPVNETQFLHVVWTGMRFVATGWGGFYDSPDGKTWHAQHFTASYGPDSLAAGPHGVVAVGTDANGVPKSWYSTDGLSWTAHRDAFPRGAISLTHAITVTGVIGTDSGWIAVGFDDGLCALGCGTQPLRALVWTSVDGSTWIRVTGQSSLAPGGMNAIAAVASGFVAAGIDAGRAAFWTSPDGHAWVRVPDQPIFGRPSGSAKGAVVAVSGLAAIGASIVAVGEAALATPDGGPIVMAWRSGDGTTWVRSTVERAAEGQVFSVAATGSRFLATGPSGSASCLGGIWSSVDGGAWSCEADDPIFEGFGPYAAAGSPTVEVAVGLTDGGEDSDGLPGAVFWRPIP